MAESKSRTEMRAFSFHMNTGFAMQRFRAVLGVVVVLLLLSTAAGHAEKEHSAGASPLPLYRTNYANFQTVLRGQMHVSAEVPRAHAGAPTVSAWNNAFVVTALLVCLGLSVRLVVPRL